ncbi:MAG TPA: hypothetical protein VF936_02825 [Burkholderiales bacterium]
MELVLGALVVVVQLALAGFLTWGGWLCFREWLRGERLAAPGRAARREPKAEGFERVASLVLLALLCTTIAGLA